MLEAPTRFHYNWVKEQYLSIIQSCCHRIDRRPRVLLKLVEGRCKSSRSPRAYVGKVPLATNFQASQTFDTYRVAPFNRFAFAAARDVCQDGAPKFNPLFIEGPPGVGKTHLLQAIGNAWLALSTGTPAYLNCREFPLYGGSVTIGSPESMLESLGRERIVLVDDIHLLPSEHALQHHLREIFDLCYDSDTQMVFTANRLPRQIAELPAGLRSRLGRGLIARIREPDFKGRYQVIQTFLGHTKMEVPQDVCHYLAGQGSVNFHEVKDYVGKLQDIVEKEGHLPNLEDTALIIGEHSAPRPQILSMQVIQQQVCTAYAVSPEALAGATKSRSLVIARQVGMYLSRKLTGSTYSAVGKAFGGRDHSTVIYACRKVRAEMRRNRAFADRIVEIERELLEVFKEKYPVKFDA
jgi:chromosomal replication initiator protein